MATYAVTYRYVDDAARLDEVRPEHRAFLREQYEAGRLLLSGPLADGDPGALLIVRGDDVQDAQGVLADDPFRREGLIAEATMRTWNVVIGEFARRS
ncbi:YciI family protein [Brachybacterium sp. p3-SID1565]|uniref:YCII-related domain-containing protein n=1 Tax=Brachybacterium epidermidis TaxID=2781983 RepID=A0ABR9W212_9MICO|nr:MULTISPECIES: YciI family protein [Brachybacterium]MBE9403363.1 hypothetical protein [Brachybacterium epidermidis]MCT1384557.1 YciI family protein [Brachybacterium sp. p3-SID1565]MCT1775614.1 YciI family protein [Brachybacterium sp. p3-SID957]